MNTFNAGAGALVAAILVSGIFSGAVGAALAAVWGEGVTAVAVPVVAAVSGVATFRLLRLRNVSRFSREKMDTS